MYQPRPIRHCPLAWKRRHLLRRYQSSQWTSCICAKFYLTTTVKNGAQQAANLLRRKRLLTTYNVPVSLRGARVSSSCFRDLIWDGRNQSMHYEDTHLEPIRNDRNNVVVKRSSWVESFRMLNVQNPGRFEMAQPFRSLALDVLDALGWTYDYGKFESDMRNLMGSKPRA